MSSGKLGSHKAITSGTYNVYEVPADTYAKVVITVVGEISGSSKVKLFVSPTNTPTDIHTIQIENLTTINNGFDRTAIILPAGSWVSYYTSTSGITVTVTGVEYPTNSVEISNTALITTNGEYVLYSTPPDTVACVNAGISGVNAATNDSATTKMYLSTTNASGGSLLVNNTVGGFNTGYEKTGIRLSAGQKVILVVSSLTGQLATRVQGFEGEE
jgi:hypothetical protein